MQWEHFPSLVKSFVDRFKELFSAKEEKERRIKEEKELERKLKRKQNKNKRGSER